MHPTPDWAYTDSLSPVQADVDCAPMYPELLRLFKASFIEKHALFTRDNKTVWVTDGPWGKPYTLSSGASTRLEFLVRICD